MVAERQGWPALSLRALSQTVTVTDSESLDAPTFDSVWCPQARRDVQLETVVCPPVHLACLLQAELAFRDC